MKAKMIFNITKFEFKIFFRNFINMFFLLIFPTVMIITFGSIFGNSPMPEYNGYGTVDVSVPAYAGMIISVTGLMSLPLTLCEYREKRILKRYKATPIKPIMVIFAQAIVNLTMSIIGMVFLVIVAMFLFDLRFDGHVGVTFGIFLLSTISIFSIGFLIASIAPNMKAASAIANLVYFPMLFLTGATIPIDLMPDLMQNIVQILPVTHVVSAMQGAWIGTPFSEIVINVIILVGVAFVCFATSIKLFKWE